MYFYEVVCLKRPLLLTYKSELPFTEGSLVAIELHNRCVDAVVLNEVDTPDFKTVTIEATQNTHIFSTQQLEMAQFIATYYFASLGESLALFVPFLVQPEAEVNGEWKMVKGESGVSIEGRGKRKEDKENSTLCLSDVQDKALHFLEEHPVSLLFGDTGSGKTEIYMKYFEKMIALQKRSIFLMPEISLTPQMQTRLEAHFGEAVVMWHSKLTKKQKEKALDKIHNGTATIIAGPRSALFLPVKDLGLIIVDEEHDDSYKASSRPRYNARDMAIYMGHTLKIPVVLGSATPSLTSYVKFPHIRLKGGHFSTKRQFHFEANSEAITPLIEERIIQTHTAGSQAMMFIPTRANFKYLICNDCGFTYECPYCSVGMSLHRNARALKCHYCNFSERVPQQCPQCKGTDLQSSRIGTAEAVSLMQERHSNIRVAQFDRDVITTQNKLKKVLKAFNDGEIDLLIGTQMLSKGHDYHDVTLAVILGMDNLLNMSDYRAREKALSMLIQIAGRSGRKKSANVLVQSFNREFFEPYLENYEQFLEEEKLFREGMYPPYKKLARILFAHKNGTKAQESMQEMHEKLLREPSIQIVGFGPSPISKIANKYRFQVLLRADKSTDLIQAIHQCKNSLAEVDMDPIEFG